MHRRKEFLVYPQKYTPGDRFFWFKSKYQALKKANSMIGGASIDEDICTHPAKHTKWDSTFTGRVWIIGVTHLPPQPQPGAEHEHSAPSGETKP